LGDFVKSTDWLGREVAGIADAIAEILYRRHRFPPVVIRHAVWLYLRFTLSYRDVGDLRAERGLDISYETIRSWVFKFGPTIAWRLRRRRPRPSDRWHLDEMVVRIAGCTSGERSTMRVRSSTCWFSAGDLRRARGGTGWLAAHISKGVGASGPPI
jgi:hypothetical protein